MEEVINIERKFDDLLAYLVDCLPNLKNIEIKRLRDSMYELLRAKKPIGFLNQADDVARGCCIYWDVHPKRSKKFPKIRVLLTEIRDDINEIKKRSTVLVDAKGLHMIAPEKIRRFVEKILCELEERTLSDTEEPRVNDSSILIELSDSPLSNSVFIGRRERGGINRRKKRAQRGIDRTHERNRWN